MIKQTIITALVAAIVASVIVLGYSSLKTTNFAGVTHLSGLAVGTDGFSVTGASTFTGTTTITRSPDGFIAWDDFTMSTGTAKAVYTNTGSALMCSGSNSGAIYAKSNGFSPSLQFSMGTSTTASGYSTNLLASTTVATSTTTVVPITYSSPFVLGNGQSIVASISDITNRNASSTYYSNWAVELGISCRVLGR